MIEGVMRTGALALLCAAVLSAQEGTTVRIAVAGHARIENGRLRLAPATEQTTGAAWFIDKQRVTAGFEITFRFQITESGGLGDGADGLAFVIQNQGLDALGGRGSAGGFALGDGRSDWSKPGIPRSVAVFFDTFRNGDGYDPSNNYVAVCTNGPIGSQRWPPARLGASKRLKVNLKDGREHTARVRYKPPVMFVYLDDGEPELRVPVDLATVADRDGYAWVGFTASTGSGWGNHDILAYKLDVEQVESTLTNVESEIRYFPTVCLNDRNLCTPPKAEVTETGPDRFHVMLPAHLEWRVSIPNTAAKRVIITDAAGNTCWDVEAAEGCGGTEGTGTADGSFLVPGARRGALISKTESGRTWFSINGRKGRTSSNQGFLEFDVRLE